MYTVYDISRFCVLLGYIKPVQLSCKLAVLTNRANRLPADTDTCILCGRSGHVAFCKPLLWDKFYLQYTVFYLRAYSDQVFERKMELFIYLDWQKYAKYAVIKKKTFLGKVINILFKYDNAIKHEISDNSCASTTTHVSSHNLEIFKL